MSSALCAMFAATARLLRKVIRPKKFDRVRACRPLLKEISSYWQGGVDALWQHLDEDGAFDKIQRQTRLAGKSFRKELTSDERRLITDLLSSFHYYDDVAVVAAATMAACGKETFQAAAVQALGALGVKAADFELRNEAILHALQARKTDMVHATRHNIDAVMETIVENFFELGANPYDTAFLTALRSELGDVTTWQAKRWALTETAIAAEYAQQQTWERNGVQRKQWNILGDRTRPSHARMSGVQAAIDEPYQLASDDGAVYECLHPCDAKLPAHELINCHCWSTPVVDDEWQIDPARVWEGA